MKVGLSRLRLAALFISAMTASGTAATEEAVGPSASTCFDAAVLVRLVTMEDRGLIPDTDALLGSSSFGLELEPEKVLYSRKPFRRGRFAVSYGSHSGIRDDIRYMLVFLRDTGDGFQSLWIDFYVTRDEKGRFIRPLNEEKEPLDSSWLFPGHWIPRDYAVRQESVRYRSKDAWFAEEYDDDGNRLPQPKWIEGRALVPQNLTYVISQLADQPCEPK